MRKLLVIIMLCLIPALAWAAIGNNTQLVVHPTCVDINQQYQFRLRVNFFSPDGERLRFAQFTTGDFWDIIAVQNPAYVDVPGAWSHQVNPNGNVISWLFTSQTGYGGDVGTGDAIVYTFDAVAHQKNDLNVTMYIEGDTGGAPPHNKTWEFKFPLCSGDDDTADDDVDDDVVDDDTVDDDVVDDDVVDDDEVDDDTVDDDTTDDDAVGDDDGGDDDDSGSSCGC